MKSETPRTNSIQSIVSMWLNKLNCKKINKIIAARNSYKNKKLIFTKSLKKWWKMAKIDKIIPFLT